MLSIKEYYTFHYGMTNLKQKYNHLLNLIKSPPTKQVSLAPSL